MISRGAVIVVVLAALGMWGCSQLASVSSSAPGVRSFGRIVSVADGDTVTVRLDSGASRSVRLLAMDSPEKYATRYGVSLECGSLAASAFVERFEGSHVVLVTDPSQDGVDRYGRLLRYLELPGGADLGASEVARGLAMPYRYEHPARRYRHYRALGVRARRDRSGNWGSPCGGDFHSSLPGVQNGL